MHTHIVITTSEDKLYILVVHKETSKVSAETHMVTHKSKQYGSGGRGRGSELLF